MTTRADWADRLRGLRDHGASISAWDRHDTGVVIEEYREPGFNYRMSDLLAAVGLVQVGRLDAIVAQRRALARVYQDALRDLPDLEVVADPPWGLANYQSFWVVLPDGHPVTRDDLLRRLSERGILARRGIMAAHLEPTFAGHPHAALPVTERVTRRSLLLPLFHAMTEAEQGRVVDVLVPSWHERAQRATRGIMSGHRDLVIVGAGGLGRETAAAVRAVNADRLTFTLRGFLDDDAALAGTEVEGVPVLGPVDRDGLAAFPDAEVVVATGGVANRFGRRRIVVRLGLPTERYATVVHPSAVLPDGMQARSRQRGAGGGGGDHRGGDRRPRGDDAGGRPHPRRCGGQLRHRGSRGSARRWRHGG